MIQFDTLAPYTPPESIAIDTLADSSADPAFSCAYDSIFQLPTAAPELHRSIFSHHLLPVLHNHEIDIIHQAPSGWLLAIIALSIFLICTYIRSHQLQLLDLVQAAFDHHALDRITREASMGRKLDYSLIAIIALLPVSVVIYQAFIPHGSTLGANLSWFAITLVTTYAIYFLHNGLVRFFGSAFDNAESTNYYIATDYFFLLILGIITTAFSFFICYTGDSGKMFLNALYIVAGTVFVLRLLRCLQLILTLSKTAKFYLFYYLCILEIAPIAIAIKVAISF